MKFNVVIIIFTFSISGCVAMPDTAGPEIVHVSHVEQHFGSNPTNYGYELVGATIKWHRGDFNASAGEYYNADHALDGYRETFEARMSYDVPLK